MIWRGKKLNSYADVIDAALTLEGVEQKEFVEAYAKTGPHALSNIGYASGYYDSKTSLKIQEIFQTAHPIFGRRIVTAQEAFEIGKKLGQQGLKQKGIESDV